MQPGTRAPTRSRRGALHRCNVRSRPIRRPRRRPPTGANASDDDVDGRPHPLKDLPMPTPHSTIEPHVHAAGPVAAEDARAVAHDAATVHIPHLDDVRGYLTLPEQGPSGTTLTWASS